MNAETKVRGKSVGEIVDAMPKPEGLALLRQEFPPHQISKLPKPTKQQTEIVKDDFKKGIRCQICGSWHHPAVVHLDYVGHAALTDRLLDADPTWSWEPVGFNPDGTPALDRNGGLWIRLTVCGVTRYGYGAADGKSGGDAMKEMIGDALRNAAMRFGAALDLWHKGDLHADDGEDAPRPDPTPRSKAINDGQKFDITALAKQARVSVQTICETANVSEIAELTESKAESIIKKLRLTIEKMKATQATPATADILDDEIPY